MKKTTSKSFADIAWLAGIIDGEGSLVMERVYGKRFYKYRALLLIANNNFPLIASVSRIYEKLGVRFVYTINPNWNYSLQIKVWGYENLRKILTEVRPYLIAKKDQADLMLRYLKKESLSGERDPKVLKRYLEQQILLHKQLKAMNESKWNPRRLQRVPNRALSLKNIRQIRLKA